MITVYIKEEEKPQTTTREGTAPEVGIIWKAFGGPTCTLLSTLGFKNGFEGKLVIRFVRALALMTDEEIKAIVIKVNQAFPEKYRTEIII